MESVMQLIPLGVAARSLGMSPERLRQLANQGRVSVIRDSLGRRLIASSELERLRRERQMSGPIAAR